MYTKLYIKWYSIYIYICRPIAIYEKLTPQKHHVPKETFYNKRQIHYFYAKYVPKKRVCQVLLNVVINMSPKYGYSHARREQTSNKY